MFVADTTMLNVAIILEFLEEGHNLRPLNLRPQVFGLLDNLTRRSPHIINEQQQFNEVGVNPLLLQFVATNMFFCCDFNSCEEAS